MPARAHASMVEASEVDFASDHAIVPDRKQTTINRTVTKAPKRRGVTMKKPRNVSTSTQREALKDRTNVQNGEDDSIMEIAPVKKNSRKVSARADEENTQPAPKRAKTSSVQSSSAKATTKKRAASPDAMAVIPETQPVEDVSESIEAEPESIVHEEPPHHASTVRSISHQRVAQPYTTLPRQRSTSQQPRSFSREGSAALAERRLADGETRRRLADMTSKYEDMRLRYESLSELGNSAMESNFDKLKRATDQRAKDANDLIEALRKELSETRKSTSTNTADNAKLQMQISSLQSDQEQVRTELKEANTALSEAQNEVKSLTARLEAARESARRAAVTTPNGSAVKHRDAAASNRNASGGSNLDSTKQAALKEELYRDLTGLIINSVKRKDGEDEFSCIQTGRNGTLHFHLSVNNDSSHLNPKTPSGLSYEDAEFAYEPFFDQGRDKELIDILPDYLAEEICFPRSHAVKFYTKVVDSMTKKVVLEDEDD